MVKLILGLKAMVSAFILFCTPFLYGQSILNKKISLGKDWVTMMDQYDSSRYAGFEKSSFKINQEWKKVEVPHNWDQYEGYRRLLHGNLHGYSWYRKIFHIEHAKEGNRFFIFFEGVGSYATVWLNGIQVGFHAGGRTSFTLDVTDAINLGGEANILAVRADHPPHIKDLPWVDGGCATERGFSEGSQPMGIFRPVTLVIKKEVSIVPFGQHYWNDETADKTQAIIHNSVEISNKSRHKKHINLITEIRNAQGKIIFKSHQQQQIQGQTLQKFVLNDIKIVKPTLWSVDQPYLYQVKLQVKEGNHLVDEVITPYGIRSVRWSKGLKPSGDQRLLINGKPVFLNGIAEYEHKLGQSHAFDDEEIDSRLKQIKQLGFNSFRDAHQPHNLRYQHYWDQNGILLWTQMAAHIWYDTPAFRHNFKQLLTEWVRERRNSPSVILWGLENESTLPHAFAQECTALIRELDPTASIQRLVTTCNGGTGTDWDVPQNWTGTYGGDHCTYGEDLKKQLLVGEYGAWRTLGLHAEPPYLPNDNHYNEDRFTDILQTKIRLADSVKDSAIGHYLWLWNSHDNPGRVQGGEGNRDIDKIGPVNYKGLLTPWGEPTDAYYMYLSHYGKKEQPMLYIAMHSWPNRWLEPGVKNDIRIFSNCEEIELFNDIGGRSLGKRKHPGFGRHFEFDRVPIQYNILYAEGRINGKIVSRDTVVLHNLPQSPNFAALLDLDTKLLQPKKGYHYHYRINCGGTTYTDEYGSKWLADQPYDDRVGWGSRSWATHFDEMNPNFASQRISFDPVKGVKEWILFQTFRYGLKNLEYQFDLPNGEYQVELYFAEPWYGKFFSGEGHRIFDIAINGKIVEHKLDIYSQSGFQKALKKTYAVHVEDGIIQINFPKIYAGQAIIQAITVASKKVPAQLSAKALHPNLDMEDLRVDLQSWMDVGSIIGPNKQDKFFSIPSYLYASDYFPMEAGESYKLKFTKPTFVYVAAEHSPRSFENTGDSLLFGNGRFLKVFRKIVQGNEKLLVNADETGTLLAFRQQSGLLPAYDLKEAKNYKAAASDWKNGMVEVDFSGQKRLIFNQDTGFVAWEIQVGAADVYSFQIKYHNPFKERRQGYYEILDQNKNIMVPKTAVDIEQTKVGKWNYIAGDTKTMINAGTYFVKFYGVSSEGIMVDNLEVK